VEPRISFVTLVVRDVDASREFYVHGLGWPTELYVPHEVLMIRVGEKLVLSMWQEDDAVKELGPISRSQGAALPFTLAHNVATRGEVDQVLESARQAGAEVVAPAVERDWGGYTGYFADPDGFRWEVAYNPGPIGQSVL
jgi:catechol 2,3-dioxygenase-like lactoylglutathione lyase family enzyme